MSRRLFDPGDVARCNVSHYSSMPYGTRAEVVGIHWHNKHGWVIDVVHPYYGISSYLARNFVNESRKMPLFNQKENTMRNDRIYVDEPCFAYPLTGDSIIPTSSAALLFADNYEEMKRKIVEHEGDDVPRTWRILQAVAEATPKPVQLPYNFRAL